MKTYQVVSAIELDGKLYSEGADIELDEDTAAPALLEAGAIRDPADPGAGATGEAGEFDAACDRAIAALRAASPEDVRRFFERLRDEPEIEAKMAAAFDREDRIDRIAAAIGALDPDNKDHWLSDGKTPDIATLEKTSGIGDISAAERDRAMKLCEAAG